MKYFSNRYQGTFLGENEEMAEHCSDDSGRQEIAWNSNQWTVSTHVQVILQTQW